MKWYVLQAYSGFEKQVAEAIEAKIATNAMEHIIERVLVPVNETVEVRRGKRVKVEKKFFPGYILIRMANIDTAWHLIKDIPKVNGFLGGATKPQIVHDSEVDSILKRLQEDIEHPKPLIEFEVGEKIRVCDGPFASFSGHVEYVDEERSRLKVTVSIFGRATPVDLDYTQVEKY